MEIYLFFALMVICNAIYTANSVDWLVDIVKTPAELHKLDATKFGIRNGLVSRYFTTAPDFATISFNSSDTHSNILRAINPEAIIQLDDTVYNIGGLVTSIPRAYFNHSDLARNMSIDPNAFHFFDYKLMDPVAPFDYKPKRGAPSNIFWPPKGLRLDAFFRAPDKCQPKHRHIIVTIHYEIYVGIPLIQKWISAVDKSDSSSHVSISILSAELLDVNQQWAPLAGQNVDHWTLNFPVGLLFIETDQSHGTAVHWVIDSRQGDMPGSFEPRVNCSYSSPFSIPIEDGFESFHVHELIVGSWDPERFSLARHRMFRLLAPQAQENPIFFHLTDTSAAGVRNIIDQMADVGFEMLIYSFGTNFNIESQDESYLERIAEEVAYANSKGIEVGGYDLIALTRNVKAEWMAVNAANSSIGSACFASGWYDFLLDRFLTFFNKTGLSMVEVDGPYGGYACASKEHKHHAGEADSVYRQQALQGKFFNILQSRGIYINQPDYFFYQGGSKTGLGYDESQYSLPRWQDISISRQSVYDDTYRLIPTAGWMFAPLVQYHGGGKAATLEPLKDHLLEYEWTLAQYLSAGVAACYRGYRLYDCNETRTIVKKWVDFYKKYRDILTSDIVHIRRPDMQDIDSFMHVNPYIENRALVVVFNPTENLVSTELILPLYYAGISDEALISREGGDFVKYILARDYTVKVNFDLKAYGITWFLIHNSII